MEPLGFGSALGIELHLFRFALCIPRSWHDIKYSGAMLDATVAGVIDRFCPRAPRDVATFAKEVTSRAGPATPARAKALLFALTKLGSFVTSVGVDLDPQLCLAPAMIERFIVIEGRRLTPPTRRTLRSNLRFVARRVLVDNPPAPIALSRERAKAPYSEAELAAYFSLAAHQPTEARRHRAEGLLSLELQAATMVKGEGGPGVPELVRRILLTNCHVDPPWALVGVLARMVEGGIALGDVLADSGYAHRVPEHWALPLRALGADIVTDHHPADRGPRGTFGGAVISNGNLYCPSTPGALLALGPLARGATRDEINAHDAMSAELARYKLGRISADDADGYHRVLCPAVAGKVRCPVRERSMALSHARPEVIPPEHLPRCCTQQSMTVPVAITAKTAQKHDYPSKAHRISYARRTAVERTFSTAKDRASNDMTRGWCRVMGTTAISLFAATLFVVRNERILDAFEARKAEEQRRQAAGLNPKTRRRRRRTLSDLVTTTGGPTT
jgi:hypothetical protein